MNTVIKQWAICDSTVLVLDQYTPTIGCNVVLIDGAKHKMLPVYDAKNTIAIQGNGCFIGKQVNFVCSEIPNILKTYKK